MITQRVDGGVMVATIDAGPINLMTPELTKALADVGRAAEGDDSVKVLVLESANPDFFIAHFDVEAILGFPDGPPDDQPNGFQRMCERYRTMPKVTIAKIAGRVGGGGAELSASCDMRFGAIGQTVINQMEVPLGILPGGSGTQRLPRLLGRGRAMEVILGADDLDAETAERWGWLNRALPPGDLDAFVDRLAHRIAGFPAAAIAGAKAAILAAGPDVEPGLGEENRLFTSLVPTPEAQAAMTNFLARGGQTPEGEKRMGSLATELGDT